MNNSYWLLSRIGIGCERRRTQNTYHGRVGTYGKPQVSPGLRATVIKFTMRHYWFHCQIITYP